MLRAILFWHLSAVETLNEWLQEARDVHSCLFHVKSSIKEEGMIVFTHALHCRLNWGIYTAISHATSKIYCLISWKKMDIIWKMRCCFLSKITISKTGSFQLSSTRAVIKLKQCCICSVHMHAKPKDLYQNDIYIWQLTHFIHHPEWKSLHCNAF